MTSRNLLNIALFVFIIILIALVVVEPGKKLPITPPSLTTLKPQDVQHIKITRRGSEPGTEQKIEFLKINNIWMMKTPYALPANSFRINSINKLLSAVSLSQNDLNKLNAEEFGLNQPYASITFNHKITIVFGHNKSLKHNRYVQIDSVLHMITDTFYYQLAAKTESFIDHKILPVNSKIQGLSLPALTLSKNDGKWTVTPKQKNYSADSAVQLANEWQLSQAYDIEVNSATAETKADILIHLADKNVLRYKSEIQNDKFILSNIDSGVSYILSADRKNKLLKLSLPESAASESTIPDSTILESKTAQP